MESQVSEVRMGDLQIVEKEQNTQGGQIPAGELRRKRDTVSS